MTRIIYPAVGLGRGYYCVWIRDEHVLKYVLLNKTPLYRIHFYFIVDKRDFKNSHVVLKQLLKVPIHIFSIKNQL